jgi:molybdate transport system substrate-binding protein
VKKVLTGVLVLALSSCTANTRSDVTVFAASSLTGAFTALAKSDPSLDVTFNFGASSTLATQIAQGGSADVFASADDASMRRVAGSVGSPSAFARNELEIVVAKHNPKHIRTLADLATPGLLVALCARQVPCGALADEALAKAHAAVRSPSREENVKAVLAKVELGEADAGIVYVTDVKSAGANAEGVAIPDASNVTTTYPIAILRHSSHKAAARAFVRLVLSAAGRRVLRRSGFLPPR